MADYLISIRARKIQSRNVLASTHLPKGFYYWTQRKDKFLWTLRGRIMTQPVGRSLCRPYTSPNLAASSYIWVLLVLDQGGECSIPEIRPSALSTWIQEQGRLDGDDAIRRKAEVSKLKSDSPIWNNLWNRKKRKEVAMETGMTTQDILNTFGYQKGLWEWWKEMIRFWRRILGSPCQGWDGTWKMVGTVMALCFSVQESQQEQNGPWQRVDITITIHDNIRNDPWSFVFLTEDHLGEVNLAKRSQKFKIRHKIVPRHLLLWITAILLSWRNDLPV